MKLKLRKWLPIALGVLAALALGAFFLVRHLVDPESYRASLRSTLEEQLGRPVEFGTMDLSLWPALGLRLDDLVIGRTARERFEDPVRADRLRVGARLIPLLRGRLEVTSATVEAPVVSAYLRDDGTWEPTLPRTEADDGAHAGGEPEPGLIVDLLRVKRGRIVLRRDGPGGMVELALADVEMRLDDLGRAEVIPFELSGAAGPTGKLSAHGRLHLGNEASERPLRVESRVDLQDLSVETLKTWLSVLAPAFEPAGELLADRPFAAGVRLDYTVSSPATLDITDASVRGAGIRLIRSASGVWNVASVLERLASDSDPSEESETLLRLTDFTFGDGVVTVEDRSTSGPPATLELAGLQLSVKRARPDGPFDVALTAEGGADRGAVLDLRFGVVPAAGDSPAHATGRVEASGFDPRELRLAETLTSLPHRSIVGRPPAFGASFEATLAETFEILLRDVRVQQLDLAFERSAGGRWSLGVPVAGGTAIDAGQAATAPGTALQLRVERLEVSDASVRLTDSAGGGTPTTSTLAVTRLTLDRLPDVSPATLALDARLGQGSLTVRGLVGPLATVVDRTPLELAIQVESLPAADVGFLLSPPENLDLARATGSADFSVSGIPAERLQASGSVSISEAVVRVATPKGEPRDLPFTVSARGDVVVGDRASRIEFPKLELELPRTAPGRTLSLRGFVAPGATPPRFDLELLPARIAVDDLAALAALFAPDAPLTFTSPAPLDLQLRATGVLGSDDPPALEGRAALSDFTFRYTGMTQPMEKVSAKVAFSPGRIALDELTGVIGASDLSGSRVAVGTFEAPRVELDIRSRRADFWELFSFMGPHDAGTATTDDRLPGLTVAGDIRIEAGSLHTLSFRQLQTTLDMKEGVLSLAPLSMELYQGRFSGRLVYDLENGELTLAGNGEQVEVDDFLTANLALGGVISGRTSTELDVRVKAADPNDLLIGLSGGGPVTVRDGHLAKIEVLRSLSKVAGIFGERSLKQLTRQLSTTGTAFTRAEARLAFDSGRVVFDDLVVETPNLTLAGNSALDSTTGKMQGRFAVAFSPELSATMRDEKSRAAGLFWDPRTQRVSFAFAVKGPVTAPEIQVDWESAVRGAVERKLTERLRGLLGASLPPDKPVDAAPKPEPSPATPTTTATTDAPPPAGTDDVPATVPEPTVRIDRTRWTGPVLLRDLVLEGTVEGLDIERVSLVLRDTRGSEIQKIDRVKSVDAQLAGVGGHDEVSIPWSVKIDGKRLAVARFPVTATVTVHRKDGGTATTAREVNR